MRKPLRQRARVAFSRYRERLRQRFAKPKVGFLEARKNAANYSAKFVSKWRYEDTAENVQNPMAPESSAFPHLILHDKTGTPRFSLCYARSRGALVVTSIQRERTMYAGPSRFRLWSSYLETRASKKFQEQLGGIHPAEFLFSEFIYRNRASIRRGTQVWLDFGIGHFEFRRGGAGRYARQYTRHLLRVYNPLIERFCKKTEKGWRYPISPEKRRVKEILEVP